MDCRSAGVGRGSSLGAANVYRYCTYCTTHIRYNAEGCPPERETSTSVSEWREIGLAKKRMRATGRELTAAHNLADDKYCKRSKYTVPYKD